MLATADIFLFEGLRLDRRGGLSRQNECGAFVPIPIGVRALDVLCALVEHPGELVLKEAIMTAVWGRTAVENANLTVQIATLRRVLDRDRTEGSLIQTVAGRGYRFIAPMTRVEQRTRLETTLAATRDPSVAGSPAAIRALDHRSPAITPTDLPAVQVRPARILRKRIALAGIGLTIAGSIFIALAAWWLRPGPASSPAATTAGVAVPPAASAPRLSIVVLPFANLSDDREQQYFADGITDDLTTDLSRLTGMFVIARNTALAYKDKPIDAKQIGRELGVRYVLEGSVRRLSNQVRVNAQLGRSRDRRASVGGALRP